MRQSEGRQVQAHTHTHICAASLPLPLPLALPRMAKPVEVGVALELRFVYVSFWHSVSVFREATKKRRISPLPTPLPLLARAYHSQIVANYQIAAA